MSAGAHFIGFPPSTPFIICCFLRRIRSSRSQIFILCLFISLIAFKLNHHKTCTLPCSERSTVCRTERLQEILIIQFSVKAMVSDIGSSHGQGSVYQNESKWKRWDEYGFCIFCFHLCTSLVRNVFYSVNLKQRYKKSQAYSR